MGNSSVSKSDQVTRLKALSLECNIPEVSFTKNCQPFRVHDGSKDGLAVLLR